jgi:hypothetical protein
MKNRSKHRVLAFEPLETKATPSSLLLALAPLDESCHVTVDQLREQAPSADSNWMTADTTANWQFTFTTRDLLKFVDDNTIPRDKDTGSIERPSAEQCQRVDEMMKLADDDARAMIVPDTTAATDFAAAVVFPESAA